MAGAFTVYTSGEIREWHDGERYGEGWGVLDSAETPGGCWAHESVMQYEAFEGVSAGQAVEFTSEKAQVNGYDYRAIEVCPL